MLGSAARLFSSPVDYPPASVLQPLLCSSCTPFTAGQKDVCFGDKNSQSTATLQFWGQRFGVLGHINRAVSMFSLLFLWVGEGLAAQPVPSGSVFFFCSPCLQGQVPGEPGVDCICTAGANFTEQWPWPGAWQTAFSRRLPAAAELQGARGSPQPLQMFV